MVLANLPLLPTTIGFWTTVFSIILFVEFLFYILFHLVLIPRANRRTMPQSYRDYPIGQRSRLLLRILERMKVSCKITRRDYKDVVREFMLQWFRENDNHASPSLCRTKAGATDDIPPVETTDSGASSSRQSSCCSSNQDEPDANSRSNARILLTTASQLADSWTIPNLHKQDTDLFFAWAFFGRDVAELTGTERIELESFYPLIRRQCEGLCLKSSKQPLHSRHAAQDRYYLPRRLSLENVNSIHRPLFVYVLILLFRALVCACILRILGFCRLQSATGLVAWYRPARSSNSGSEGDVEDAVLPLLFFHGIAPAGLLCYVLMILHLIQDGRAAYLFENPAISYHSWFSFQALTELETVQGVQEILRVTGLRKGPLALVGHSFGSCPLTWLLNSPLQERIRQFVLLDPVTILLSEPDVMNNFLYSKEISKINVVASSELFTEHYLRRHFSWYNSELWLEDLPPHVSVLVALSQHDEIINPPKVKQHLDMYNEANSNFGRCQIIYWKNVGHANCIFSKSKWNEVRSKMLQQELSSMQER